MTIDVAEALMTAGIPAGEELPAMACALLVQGVDSLALRQLAGLVSPTFRDAGPLFLQVLRDLNRPTMSFEAAADIIARDLAERVLQGELSPAAASASGARFAMAFDYRGPFAEFMSFDDEYDGHWGRTHQQLDSGVRDLCREILTSSRPPHQPVPRCDSAGG